MSDRDRYYSKPPSTASLGFGYGFAGNAVGTGGGSNALTGVWTPIQLDSAGNLLTSIAGGITLSGATISVPPNTFITGNPFVSIQNPVTVIDSGIRAVSFDRNTPLNVSGYVISVVTGAVSASFDSSSIVSAQASGNAYLASISGRANQVVPVSGQVGLTNSILAVSGVISTTSVDTGNRSVLVTNPVLAVSGVVQANVSTVDTGNRSVLIVNGVVPVSGSVQSTILNGVLPISGVVTANVSTVDTGIRAVNVTNGVVPVSGNVTITNAGFINNGGFVGLTGNPVVTITGVVATSASVTIGNVHETGLVNTTDTTGNLYLAAISGLLSSNLTTAAWVTGDIRNIPGTVLAISGVVQASVSTTDTGIRAVNVTNTAPINISGWVTTIVTGGSVSASVTNPLGVTGISKDVNPIYSGVNTYNFLPVGGRAVQPSGVGAVTGYGSGDFAILNFSRANGGLFVHQANLDYTQDTVTITPSGNVLAISGVVQATLSAQPIVDALTSGNNYLASISGRTNQVVPVSGLVGITNSVLSVSGNSTIINSVLAVSGITQANLTNGILPVSGLVSDNAGNLYLAAISGRVSQVVPISGLVGITNTAPIPVSGVVVATLDPSAIVSAQSSGNAYLASISGRVNQVVPVSGLVGLTNSLLAVSGNVTVLGTVTVSVSNTPTVTVGNSLLAVSGNATITNSVLAISGVVTAGVSNPIGVTGVTTDRYNGYTGAGLAVVPFLPVGGRAVNPSGVGAITGYSTGDSVVFNFNAQNGGVFVHQANLNEFQDAVTTRPSGALNASANTVSGTNNSLWGTPLPSNPARLAWGVQNMSTGAMFVRMGTLVNSGNAHFILKGGTAVMDGLGASWTDSPAVWRGPVSISGYFSVSPIYSAWEL